jgi:hypothetical protein
MPTGEADGGRDAVEYLIGTPAHEFIVYQVKYSQHPARIADPVSWLDKALENETRIAELTARGMRGYYLMTNVRGTGSLDAGTIDRLHEVLRQRIPVHAECWWRDDLDSRLENAWDLKWSYPELLSGNDLLGILVSGRLSEHQERRSTALRTYVRTQYEADRHVRFKQVELQNSLLDLFVDVPVSLPARGRSADSVRADQNEIHELMVTVDASMPQDHTAETDPFEFGPAWQRDRPIVGAASLLLHPLMQSQYPYVVLEGGARTG